MEKAVQSFVFTCNFTACHLLLVFVCFYITSVFSRLYFIFPRTEQQSRTNTFCRALHNDSGNKHVCKKACKYVHNPI